MAENIPSGKLIDGRVLFGPEAITELYDQGYFGRPTEGGLQLSLVESAYLLDRGKIRVFDTEKELAYRNLFELSSGLEKGFEFRYVVYKDLRERGYYLQPGVPDFRVYPRGGHPGKTPAEFYVCVVSERLPFQLKEILEPMRIAQQMRKRLMLAIVDEESDITYYEAKEKTLSGKMEEDISGGMATLLEDRVMLWDATSSDQLHEKGFYGKPVGERLQLSLVESAYLLEKGAIQVVDRSGDSLEIREFSQRAGKVEDDFEMKYQVYRDLRERGLVAKTGFKFGSHFRVYKHVESSKKARHSEYLVHSVPEDYIFHLPSISRAVRLAHSVRKQMIFAYQDDGVKYLEIGRLKP
jgi:tRNA-intron endonuclease